LQQHGQDTSVVGAVHGRAHSLAGAVETVGVFSLQGLHPSCRARARLANRRLVGHGDVLQKVQRSEVAVTQAATRGGVESLVAAWGQRAACRVKLHLDFATLGLSFFFLSYSACHFSLAILFTLLCERRETLVDLLTMATPDSVL